MGPSQKLRGCDGFQQESSIYRDVRCSVRVGRCTCNARAECGDADSVNEVRVCAVMVQLSCPRPHLCSDVGLIVEHCTSRCSDAPLARGLVVPRRVHVARSTTSSLCLFGILALLRTLQRRECFGCKKGGLKRSSRCNDGRCSCIPRTPTWCPGP